MTEARNPIGLQVTFSLLFAMIYVERLIVDISIWGGKGQQVAPISSVLRQGVLYVWFGFVAVVVLVGVAAPPGWLSIVRKAAQVVSRVLRERLATALLAPLVVFVAAAFVLLVVNVVANPLGADIVVILQRAWAEVLSEIRTWGLVVAGAIGAAAVLAVVLAVLARIPVGRNVQEVYDGWVMSWFAFVCLTATNLLVYVYPHLWKLSGLGGLLRPGWQDWLKDTIVYGVGGCVLAGLIRWGGLVERRLAARPWSMYLGSLAIVILGTVQLIVLDFLFLGSPEFARLASARQGVIRAHIYLRDLGLFVPIIVLVYVWLGRRIAHAMQGRIA